MLATLFDSFASFSYPGIIVFLILTGVGLPVPEEVAIIYAGVMSAPGGDLQWEWALASCLVGCLIGDSLMYYIGYHFGENVLKKHPWYTGFLTSEREAQLESMIDKHGLKVFFAARFMVGVRGPVYVTAGILRVPFRKFFLADLISATTVVGLFFGLSYVFGEEIKVFIRDFTYAITALVLVVILIIFFSVKKRMRPRVPDHLAEGSNPREQADADPNKTIPDQMDSSEADSDQANSGRMNSDQTETIT